MFFAVASAVDNTLYAKMEVKWSFFGGGGVLPMSDAVLHFVREKEYNSTKTTTIDNCCFIKQLGDITNGKSVL